MKLISPPQHVDVEWLDASQHSDTLALDQGPVDYWAKPFKLRSSGWLVGEGKEGVWIGRDYGVDAEGDTSIRATLFIPRRNITRMWKLGGRPS